MGPQQDKALSESVEIWSLSLFVLSKIKGPGTVCMFMVGQNKMALIFTHACFSIYSFFFFLLLTVHLTQKAKAERNFKAFPPIFYERSNNAVNETIRRRFDLDNNLIHSNKTDIYLQFTIHNSRVARCSKTKTIWSHLFVCLTSTWWGNSLSSLVTRNMESAWTTFFPITRSNIVCQKEITTHWPCSH